MHFLFTAAAGGFKHFFTDSYCFLPFLLFTASLSFLIILKLNYKNNKQKISELGEKTRKNGNRRREDEDDESGER